MDLRLHTAAPLNILSRNCHLWLSHSDIAAKGSTMVSLTKGQSISLAKEPRPPARVAMGLGWDVAKRKGFLGRMIDGGNVDLDASCLVYDASGRLIDNVWFGQLASKDGSIVHSGDNRTGAGDGDDEVINVDLTRVPAAAQTLVFTVNSFTGITFERIENAFCRIVDAADNREIARYSLSAQGPHTAQVMAKLSRSGGDWSFTAIGAIASGTTFHALEPAIKPHL